MVASVMQQRVKLASKQQWNESDFCVWKEWIENAGESLNRLVRTYRRDTALLCPYSWRCCLANLEAAGDQPIEEEVCHF
jgi:hypothetical protein